MTTKKNLVKVIMRTVVILTSYCMGAYYGKIYKKFETRFIDKM